MNSRDALKATLDHRDPGRIVVDFGSTGTTGMHVTCVAALRRHYGLEEHPVTVSEPYQMLGKVEDDLLDALGVDTTSVPSPGTMFGFPPEDWKEWRTPWGQDVRVPGAFEVDEGPDGVVIYPCGDRSVPPSGHMPKGGFFFDSITRQKPIDEDRLDPEDNLEEFGPISDADLDHFDREVAQAASTGRGVVATFGGTAFGDIALVPGPFLKDPKGIRDVAEWYMSTAMRQDYIHAVFSKQLEYALANLEKIYARVGDAVDVVFLCGTDFGTQTSSFCSPATFDSLWLPYYKVMNDWIHANTSWRTFKHSCGAVAEFMPHFIEAGFDIINPVQCSATGMDPQMLKDTYGDQLVFWGGGVDTQHVLPFGTPEEVREQVLERCRIFSPGGGFVFDAIHNVQANTPNENIVAMIEAVRRFAG